MRVFKRWVWPSCKALVAVAVAAALVKLAFFPAVDADPADAGATPSGALTEPVAAVERGTITNEVTVDGRILADATTTTKAGATGTVTTLSVDRGQAVQRGTRIAQIRTEAPAPLPDDPSAPPAKPKVTFTDVLAETDGTVRSVDVVKGQEVTIGDAVAVVAPGSFHVEATLEAADLYRLLQRPDTATVTVPGGPAPFACTGLTIGAAPDGDDAAGAGSGAGGAGSAASTVLSCAVPADVTVFSGLTASVAIAAGVAEDVLTVPVTAVQGSAQSGTVTALVGKRDRHEERTVALGINDGIRIEVRDGLAEGDRVLEFVPGTEAVDDGSGTESGGGVVIG